MAVRLKQIYDFISIQIAPILISISDRKAVACSYIRTADQVYNSSKQLDCAGKSGGDGRDYPRWGPPLHHSSSSNHGVAGGQIVVDYYYGPSANIWPGTVSRKMRFLAHSSSCTGSASSSIMKRMSRATIRIA